MNMVVTMIRIIQWTSSGIHSKIIQNNVSPKAPVIIKVLFLSMIVFGGEGGNQEILCHKIEEALKQMKRYN